MEYKYSDITEKIIKCAYDVYNSLGSGFLEKVYENALVVKLNKTGLKAEQQFPISVSFENEIVGEFIADILVEDKIILELKAIQELNEVHEAQIINYLKATGIEIGLLLNFGPKIQIKRKIFTKKI
jgi:GxxExxY protein